MQKSGQLAYTVVLRSFYTAAQNADRSLSESSCTQQHSNSRKWQKSNYWEMEGESLVHSDASNIAIRSVCFNTITRQIVFDVITVA